MSFISNLKFIGLFSNLIGSQSLIDKHHHSWGYRPSCDQRENCVIFISINIHAHACQRPVYSGCNFTLGKILCIRLTHPLLLYRIFNPSNGIFVKSVSKLSTRAKTFVHGFLTVGNSWTFLSKSGRKKKSYFRNADVFSQNLDVIYVDVRLLRALNHQKLRIIK